MLQVGRIGGENVEWLDYNVAECDWFISGSTDCIDGRYEKLDLRNNGLSGELPDALAVLTDLRIMVWLTTN
jgi:hypothetical protein